MLSASVRRSVIVPPGRASSLPGLGRRGSRGAPPSQTLAHDPYADQPDEESETDPAVAGEDPVQERKVLSEDVAEQHDRRGPDGDRWGRVGEEPPEAEPGQTGHERDERSCPGGEPTEDDRLRAVLAEEAGSGVDPRLEDGDACDDRPAVAVTEPVAATLSGDAGEDAER